MASPSFTAGPGEFELFLEENLNREMLRFTTAGSVDDGKSTLIGRLLHDSKSVYEDQLASVRNSRINRSSGPLDFSLLTDGLRAEREQGITIDVAYRYFATSRRKFIIADTPGHEQYTRNMATGASTAELAIVLLDATKGVLPQTRRHAHIASLLGIPHLLVAINKMDAVHFDQEIFDRLRTDAFSLATNLNFKSVQSIPVSALDGANVVTRSARTPWYSGPTLLEHLESVPVGEATASRPVRFPIQYVIRPDASFRGYAGQISSGQFRPGERVVALPSGQTTRIRSIEGFEESLPEAFAPMSVTVTLENEIDVGRGDMLVAHDQLPHISRDFLATLVWMHPQPLVPGANLILKHTSRQVRARIRSIRSKLDIESSEQTPASSLGMNDIASVVLETTQPLFFDLYSANRVTGSFTLIDRLSNATLAAGMIQASLQRTQGTVSSEHDDPVTRDERETRNGHPSAAIFLTGRPRVIRDLERLLFDDGILAASSRSLPSLDDEVLTTAPILASLGAIVIYDVAEIGEDIRNSIATVHFGQTFDLDRENLPADNSAAAQYAFQSVKQWLATLRKTGES
jgi:bifunctional enzyme CysN/CysC/sulfate adenylyltransferase subunit 1